MAAAIGAAGGTRAAPVDGTAAGVSEFSTAAAAPTPALFTSVEPVPCAPPRRTAARAHRRRLHPRRRPPVTPVKAPARRRPLPRTLAELAHRPVQPTRCEVERQSPLYTTTAVETPSEPPTLVSDAIPPTGRLTTVPAYVNAGEQPYGPSLVPDFPTFPGTQGGPEDRTAAPPSGAPPSGAPIDGGGPSAGAPGLGSPIAGTPGTGAPGAGSPPTGSPGDGVSPAPEPAQWLLLALATALCGLGLRLRPRPAATHGG